MFYGLHVYDFMVCNQQFKSQLISKWRLIARCSVEAPEY